MIEPIIGEPMTEDEVFITDPVTRAIMRTWAELEPNWASSQVTHDSQSQITRITHYALASRSADLFGDYWISVFKGERE